MNDQSLNNDAAAILGKFQDPFLTAKGEERAQVPLIGATTLWFNTGTLCNIACLNCYIESSPENDRLVYISRVEVEDYLDQIADRDWPVEEIGFTGGEPFMNPEMIEMTEACLARGFRVLILTNAMRPMMRKRVQAGLTRLHDLYGDKLLLRVSLDHYLADMHDEERGPGTYEITLEGMRWIRDQRIEMAVAGRLHWDNDEAKSRAGYAELFERENLPIDAANPAQTVLFPEMDEHVDVPEITTACWGILNKDPASIMCASSRMVVKRKGASAPAVLACTLLPYSSEFELGQTLAEAERPVRLNHPHCSKFCVLGGASCSA